MDDKRDVRNFPKTLRKGKSLLIEVGDGLYIQVNYFEYRNRYSYSVFSATAEDPETWIHNITNNSKETFESEVTFIKSIYNLLPMWLEYEIVMFPYPGGHVLSREEVYEERDNQKAKEAVS
jgi:hypothetical protein